MSGKFFVCLPNLRVIRENFFGMSRKKFCAPPLARQQFPGEILINHVRAKTVSHQTRLGPSAHGDWLTTRMQML
jgi:hypothetical protein